MASTSQESCKTDAPRASSRELRRRAHKPQAQLQQASSARLLCITYRKRRRLLASVADVKLVRRTRANLYVYLLRLEKLDLRDIRVSGQHRRQLIVRTRASR